MATPSSQVIAIWVQQVLTGESWSPLEDVCVQAVKNNWTGASDTQIYGLVEQNLPYVAEHLRDEASEFALDGAAPTFQIDDEQLPYIRALSGTGRDLLAKLRVIDPFAVEQVCADVMDRLGADARTTQRTND